MEEATVETLLALLRGIKLGELHEQLSENPTLLAVWNKRSKDDWEKYHGLNGVDIYNHLNPQTRLPEALRAKNHVIAGVDVFNHLNSEIECVIGSFKLENDDETLKKYLATAILLQETQELKDIVQFLVELKKGADKSETDMAFGFGEASSGIGKTQTSIAAMTAMSKEINSKKALFLVTITSWDNSLNMQKIYQCFRNPSALFMNCAMKDLKNLRSRDSGDISERLSVTNLKHATLYIFGFIEHFSTEGYANNDVVEKNDVVEQEARIFAKKAKGIQGQLSAAFLDEFLSQKTVEEGVDFDLYRLIRNSFRAAKIPIFLTGTDSRAANLVNRPVVSRVEIDEECIWCRIFTKFPTYKSINIHTLNETAQNVVINSRPWFAYLAEQFLLQETKDAVQVDVDLLQKVCKSLYNSIVKNKGIFNHSFGRHGQVCLFLDASFDEPQVSQGELEASPRNKKLIRTHGTDQLSNSMLIHRHFAVLQSKTAIIDLDGRMNIKGTEETWRATSVFPAVQCDLLLYLALLGNPDCPAFKTLTGERASFKNAVTDIFQKPRVLIINWTNSKQRVNDGSVLESILASAVCVASHAGGFAGVSLTQFLCNLVFEISKNDGAVRKIIGLESILPTFPLQIPYLSPPNQKWPEYLNGITGGLFSNLIRTTNSSEIDFKSSCGTITGESKDYRDVIDKATMVSMIEKIGKTSVNKPKIHIIIANQLQQSYFSMRSSFENEFSSDAFAMKCAFFKITDGKIQTIDGLVSATAPQCLVFFLIGFSP